MLMGIVIGTVTTLVVLFLMGLFGTLLCPPVNFYEPPKD